jgi:deoxyribose-phosphate aldolase
MVSVTWLEGFDPSYIFKSKQDFKNWLLSHIDLTYLPAYLPESKLKEFIKKAIDYGFSRVCIPITAVSKAEEFIAQAGKLELITFISSFHGNRNTVEEKKQACSSAISFNATEIEFSPNLSLLVDNPDSFKEEINSILEITRQAKKQSKVYLEIDKLPDELIGNAIKLSQECLPDYISIFIRLLEEESYDGENLNFSKEWFEKIDKALGKDKKTNLKVYGRIDNFNNLLPILYLATKYGWNLDNLRIGTEYGFDILDGLDVS